MQSAEDEPSRIGEPYSDSIWDSWETPIIIVTATVLIAAIILLIWCAYDVFRGPLTPCNRNSGPSFCSNRAIQEADGAKASSIARVNGLRNLGNTCYFNAAIQCLLQTTILRRKLIESPTTVTGDVTVHLIKLLNETSSQSDSVPTAKDLHSKFCSKVPKFRGHRQHDTHEFLRNFLDELRKEETGMSASKHNSLTVIDRIFGGHQITVYTCCSCHAPFHRFEAMLDISLPVRTGGPDIISTESSLVAATSCDDPHRDDPYRNAVKQMMIPLSEFKHKGPNPIKGTETDKRCPINDSLRHFTRVEHIKDEYLCNECPRKHPEGLNEEGPKTSATKQTLIFNPPAILTIHLKRFELKPGRSIKVNDMLEFDELLDIGPYCSSQCLRMGKPPSQNVWYSLYGVVVHQSENLTSGHYIAFVKVREREPELERFLQEEYFDRNITSEQLVELMRRQMRHHPPTSRLDATDSNKGDWYLVNDSRVRKVTVETVLKQKAYLLFYERLQSIPNAGLFML